LLLEDLIFYIDLYFGVTGSTPNHNPNLNLIGNICLSIRRLIWDLIFLLISQFKLINLYIK